MALIVSDDFNYTFPLNTVTVRQNHRRRSEEGGHLPNA